MQAEQIQKEVNAILGRNDGNRLTTEVSVGISMAIQRLIMQVRAEDKAVFDEHLKSLAKQGEEMSDPETSDPQTQQGADEDRPAHRRRGE